MEDLDTMDGVLSLDDLVLATGTVEPYVLSWVLDPESEEDFSLRQFWRRAQEERRAQFLGLISKEAEEQQEQQSASPQPRRRRPALRGATPSAAGPKPKAKRVTTASLAQNMRSLLDSLPKISAELGRLSDRQAAMEARLPVGGKPLPLPLSQSFEPTPASQIPLTQLARATQPPPRTAARASPGLLASPGVTKPPEIEALEDEKLGQDQTLSLSSGDSLARAVYAQSQALTSLVNQVASNHSDPIAELTGSSSSGTRGASARAKLQAELASHRGVFFQAVLQSMARRMAPTSSSNVPAEELLQRGVSGVRYLERFGGYGRCRELGQLQYQVMSIFDFMMAQNFPAAMDGLALLAVTLEQACLDNGRMELATLLCLQEDPPASIFINRQLSLTSRARAFAPLADQRWVTCALAFLKELEVINAKRTEMTGAKQGSETSSGNAPAAANPKGKAKGKKKGKGKGEKSENAPAEDAES
eukprot:s1965_g15.t1